MSVVKNKSKPGKGGFRMKPQIKPKVSPDERTRVVDLENGERIRLTEKEGIEGTHYYLEIGPPSSQNAFWLRSVRCGSRLRPDEIEPIIQLLKEVRS